MKAADISRSDPLRSSPKCQHPPQCIAEEQIVVGVDPLVKKRGRTFCVQCNSTLVGPVLMSTREQYRTGTLKHMDYGAKCQPKRGER